MSQKKYNRDGKIGCISVYPNAVIVERVNKRTCVIKQTSEGDTEDGMILQLKSLVTPEDINKSSSEEEIVKGKLRVISIGLAPTGALSIYVALGAYLESQGLLKDMLPELAELEPEE